MIFVACVFIQAADANTAQVVKVVPTANNGYTELVKLHKQKVCVWSFVLNFVLLDNIVVDAEKVFTELLLGKINS